MPKTTDSKKNRRNRSREKNRRGQSQKAEKQKSRIASLHPMSQRTHLRNESQYSSKRFLGEYSDKGLSAQYLRPNIHPIYQEEMVTSSEGLIVERAASPALLRERRNLSLLDSQLRVHQMV